MIRKDLPLGHLAAQVAHAAGATARHDSDTHVVVLAVASEPDLIKVAQRLELAAVKHAVIRESDGPYAGQSMAIGCELVVDRSAVRRAVGSLPLLR